MSCTFTEQDLAEPSPSPELARHLERCAPCRLLRRELLVYNDSVEALAEENPEGIASGLIAELAEDASRAARTLRVTDLGVERSWIPLGRGPRGPVWSVFDVRRELRVVLKMVSCADRARLVRTREQINRLEHPNLVPWLDIAEIGSGELVARRRQIDGRSLDAAAPEARRHRLLQWVARAASALSALHSAGCAHGGLCPDNLWIETSGRLFVTDAGLGGLPEGSRWRAPELGREDASPEGDWYALGRIIERCTPQLADGAHYRSSLPALVARMCDPDPSRRPPGEEVLLTLLLEVSPEGMQVTRYEQDELIHSNMGEIRRVWDPIARRRVVIKQLTPKLLRSADAARRFRNEYRIAAQLEHPSIVPVYEVNPGADMPYFTMKYIDGERLGEAIGRKWRDEPGYSLTRLMGIFLKLCEAVAYAHSRGVIHLDLKPDNVMVGAFGEVQLIDWGIARTRRLPSTVSIEGSEGSPAQSRPHWVSIDARDEVDKIGYTPGWAPPEQEKGDVGKLSERTDVGALGHILFFILTGQDPSALRKQHSPLPAIRHLDATVPPDLAAVAERALAALPEERHPDADALRADISAWLAGEELPSYRYSMFERFERKSRPYQGYLALGLVSLLTLGATGSLGAFAWYQSTQSYNEAQIEASRRIADRADRELASGDRIAAERSALEAIARAQSVGAGSPVGRGLLARIARDPFPRLLARCPAGADGSAQCPDGLRWVVGTALQVEGAPVMPSVGAEGDTVYVEADNVRTVSEPLGERVERVFPCGKGVALQTAQGMLAIWSASLGRIEIGPVGQSSVVACDPRGRKIAVSAEEVVAVWTIQPLAQEASLAGHHEPVTALAWSADGRTLASSGDNSVRLWDPSRWYEPQGAEIARLPGPASALAFTPKGDRLLVGTNPVALWDLSAAGSVARVDAMVQLKEVSWSGGSLVTLDRHGNLRLWDPATGDPQGNVEGTIAAVAARPDGASLALLTPEGELSVRTRTEAGWRTRWTAHAGATAVSASSDRFVATGGEGGVTLWDAVTGAVIARAPGPVIRLQLVGDRVLAVYRDGSAALWDAAGAPQPLSGKAVHLLDLKGHLVSVPSPLGEVTAAVLSPLGDTLAVASRDGVVRVLRYTPDGLGDEIGQVGMEPGRQQSLAFSSDGRTLAVTASSRVELWDLSHLTSPVEVLDRDIEQRFGAQLAGAR